ncbi:hypothetical protein [Sphingomonas sp. 1P08PE]|uniref:hypothetical protein n=1 Tax=Sphingomonas sp. 1P08PE TaxID=554122 RepID=UPI0039A0DDEC
MAVRQPSSFSAVTITLTAEVRLTRSGRVMRLVQASGAGVTPSASAALTRLLLKARGWWATLREGELDISTLAAREGIQPAYLTRVLRLAFLAPAVTEAILAGKVRPEVDVGMLTLRGTVEPLWTEQVARLLPQLR